MNSVENPVHERPGLFGGKLLRQIDGFVEDDLGRRIRAVHFMNRQTQDGAIDCGQPFEPPVVGMLHDDRVECGTSFAAPSNSLFAKARVLSAALALFQNLDSSLLKSCSLMSHWKSICIANSRDFVRRDTLLAPWLSGGGRLRRRGAKLA